MKAYEATTTPEMIEENREAYHIRFLETRTTNENAEDDQQQGTVIEDDQDKAMALIPSRKQIKAQSARLVEEASKREEAD